MTNPLPYIVIDIETGNASKAVIDRAAQNWEPPANVKDPEKIAERRSAAYASIVDKSALLDGSPITCVAIVCGQVREVFSGDNEITILNRVRKALDEATGPETVIIGHNVISFDLPRLRGAYVRNRLALPMIFRLAPTEDGQPAVFDTMRRFRYFTSERHEERYVRLQEVVAAFGLPSLKDKFTGADMPRLAAEGQWATIREYCLLDAVATESVYLLMSSTHPDQK